MERRGWSVAGDKICLSLPWQCARFREACGVGLAGRPVPAEGCSEASVGSVPWGLLTILLLGPFSKALLLGPGCGSISGLVALLTSHSWRGHCLPCVAVFSSFLSTFQEPSWCHAGLENNPLQGPLEASWAAGGCG